MEKMEKKDLEKLTKEQLIKLLLKKKKSKKVSNHEDLLDNNPFKDEVVQDPAKRIKPPTPTRKPPPPPIHKVEEKVSSSKIKELNRALKGHAKSYDIELQDNLNPLNHFTKTKALVESHLENLLKGFKFIETLEVTFEKETIDSKTGKHVSIYKTAFFNGKTKTITKPNDIELELSMSRQEILNVIDKWVSEGSGWVIDRIDSHYINVTLYKPLNGSSYIELPMELRNPKKGLINIKNKDDECFRRCHIRHLNPQEKDPQRIKKEDKKMINELNYDGIDFPFSQKHYNKVEKQNSIRINVFGYENGQPFPIHISKETFENQMNLLLITKDEKKHYVLIKEDLLDNNPFKDEVAQDPAKRIKPPTPTRKPPPPPIHKVEEKVSSSKIKELNRALKGHAKSYDIELQDNLNPFNHFTKTKALVESHLENLLKGFKFIETLVVTFEKETIDSKTGKRVSIYKTAFFNGKTKTITKPNDIELELSMSRQEILNVIDKWVSEGSGWVIDRIDSHYINVTLYKPLNGSSYIELPMELRNPKKGLINIKNKDDECFRWCHIRHLNPQEKDPQRIKKEDKKMINELNYDGIDFPLSQKHSNKVEKQNSIRINVFGYENGQPFPITSPKRHSKTK